MAVSTYQKSPGVILEEVAPQDVLPATVSTGKGAMLAVTEKGPLSSTEVTSFSEWVRTFGRQLSDKDTDGNYKYPGYQQTKNFFMNGGTRLWTRRVVHYTDVTDPDTYTCVKSSVTIRDGDAGTPAVIGARVPVDTPDYNGTVISGGTFTGKLDCLYTVTCTLAGAHSTAKLTYTCVGGEDHGKSVEVTSGASPWEMTVGTKGVTLTFTYSTVAWSLGDAWTIACTAQGANALKIEAKYFGDYGDKGSVQTADSPTTGISVALATGSLASTYKLYQYENGVISRTFDQLHHNADEAGYAEFEINGAIGSTIIEVSVLSSNLPVLTYTGEIPIYGGNDGLTLLADADYIGDAGAETGIHGFNNVNDILVVGCPEKESSATVTQALVDWVDTNHPYSFVTLAPEYGTTHANAKIYHGTTLAKDSSRYAIYYPWIKSNDVWVSPTMAVVGQYMSNDSMSGRGVWWSPAGLAMSLNNVQDVEFVIGDTKGGELNELHVNVLRNTPGYGLVIWGSRTGTTSEQKYYRYIGARRNTSYVEATLRTSTQFATHHESGPTLWRKVFNVCNSFLTSHYNAGGFRGASKAQAFYLVCDSSNNTTDIEEQGITVIDVGIWNKRTSEFLIIKLAQKTGE